MPLTKAELRQQLKGSRQLLTPTQVEAKSHQINSRLMGLTIWPKVNSLHFFTPVASLNEPNIADFISHLRSAQPHLQLFTSIKQGDDWQVVDEWQNETEAKAEVFIVPCLGFDARLNRLGLGGGYYDQLLKSEAKAQKIGVCFEAGWIEQLPVESHDVAMDLIVSEAKIYR